MPPKPDPRLVEQAIEAFEHAGRADRHRLINARAAARLLMGAYGVGDITDEQYKTAIEKLIGLNPGMAFDLDEHLARIKKLREEFRKSRQKSKPLPRYLPADERALVVDDEVDTAGWRVLFDCVLNGRVLYGRSIEEAVNLVDEGGERIAVVLLDLCLPSKPEQGLQALRQMKDRHLDLPVVVFSGIDEIRYARKCLASGATEYFVKELYEIDRSAVGYFERLKQTVADAIGHPEWREVWRRIEGLSGPGTDAEGSALLKEVREDLRRAYFFLTTDEHDPRVRLFFPSKPHKHSVYAHCILECGNALERVVNDQSDKLERQGKRSAEAQRTLRKMGIAVKTGGKLPLVSVAGKSRLGVLVTEKIVGREECELAKQIWKRRARAAHPRSQPANVGDATKVILMTLKFMEAFFARFAAPKTD